MKCLAAVVEVDPSLLERGQLGGEIWGSFSYCWYLYDLRWPVRMSLLFLLGWWFSQVHSFWSTMDSRSCGPKSNDSLGPTNILTFITHFPLYSGYATRGPSAVFGPSQLCPRSSRRSHRTLHHYATFADREVLSHDHGEDIGHWRLSQEKGYQDTQVRTPNFWYIWIGLINRVDWRLLPYELANWCPWTAVHCKAGSKKRCMNWLETYRNLSRGLRVVKGRTGMLKIDVPPPKCLSHPLSSHKMTYWHC